MSKLFKSIWGRLGIGGNTGMQEVQFEGYVPTQAEIDKEEISVRIISEYHSLPFEIDEDDVWLITGPGRALTGVDLDHLDTVFQHNGRHFLCYKTVFETFNAKSLAYEFPGTDLNVDTFRESEFNKAIGKALGVTIENNTRLLIRFSCGQVNNCDKVEKRDYECHILDASESNLKQFLISAYAYAKSIKSETFKEIMFSMTSAPKDDAVGLYRGRLIKDSGRYTEEDLEEMGEETYEYLRVLMKHKKWRSIIKQWVNPAEVISRIYIDKDFNVFFPDYSKEPVKMNQLGKALWILFLRHEEGCRVKEIELYEDELNYIYDHISIFADQERNRRSIKSLVDPLNEGDSFYRNQNRAHSGLLTVIPKEVAEKYYYIVGERGDLRQIKIDRSLVTWEKYDY